MSVRTAVLAVVAALLPSPGQAQGAARAEVEGAGTRRAVAGGAVWRCADGVCAGVSRGGRFGDARACGDLARIGRVASFAGAGGAMTPDGLAECNRRAGAGR